jgi:hypothetical protein
MEATVGVVPTPGWNPGHRRQAVQVRLLVLPLEGAVTGGKAVLNAVGRESVGVRSLHPPLDAAVPLVAAVHGDHLRGGGPLAVAPGAREHSVVLVITESDELGPVAGGTSDQGVLVVVQVALSKALPAKVPGSVVDIVHG